jgi:uncharacterized membrane protein YebE (DUF533 family)
VNSFALIALILGGIAAVGGLSYWVGQRIQKGKQTQATEEARNRMEAVSPNDLPSTAKRLRGGKF